MVTPTCYCNYRRYGYAIVENVLVKFAEGSRHKLLKPLGWAVQEQILRCHSTEIRFIQITDVETGVCYTVNIRKFYEHAFPIDRGSGEQLVLREELWNTTKAKTVQTAFPL